MTEQVYDRYYDTVGNYHWTGVYSGKHIERGERMSNSIRRQDAIDAYCEHECGKGMTREKCGTVDCGTIFDDIPSAQKWIPCSERLPRTYCLFCDIDGDVFYGHRYDGEWWADGQDDRIKNVIAWMPLPEPYKESEDKERQGKWKKQLKS